MKKWNISSLEDLLSRINTSEANLNYILKSKKQYYGEPILIPKRVGSRTIYSVDKNNDLYRVQLLLKKNYLDKIFLPEMVCGFVKGKSYSDYLAVHTNYYGRNFLALDITCFFDSIKERHIDGAFEFILKDVEDKDVVKNYIEDIILYNGSLVQGSPIAPVVSNIAFRNIDIRIERYCEKLGVTYSRYADDMLFSSDDNTVLSRRFYSAIRRILDESCFQVNRGKTKNAKSIISFDGFVIENSVRLSRKRLKDVGRILYSLEGTPYRRTTNKNDFVKDVNRSIHENKSIVEFTNFVEIINYLCGYRSFLIQVKKQCQGKDYQRISRVVKRIEGQLDRLQK